MAISSVNSSVYQHYTTTELEAQKVFPLQRYDKLDRHSSRHLTVALPGD